MQVDADEDNFEHDGDGRWPFRGFVEQIILDMFDPSEFVYILLGVVLYYAVHNQLILSLKIYLQFGRFAMVVLWH